MSAAERAQAAAWAALRECRTDLLAARVLALEAQVRLAVTGSAQTERASELSEKIAGAVEHCEGLTLYLAVDKHAEFARDAAEEGDRG